MATELYHNRCSPCSLLCALCVLKQFCRLCYRRHRAKAAKASDTNVGIVMVRPRAGFAQAATFKCVMRKMAPLGSLGRHWISQPWA